MMDTCSQGGRGAAVGGLLGALLGAPPPDRGEQLTPPLAAGCMGSRRRLQQAGTCVVHALGMVSVQCIALSA
jgi:hypothetical protein